MTTEVDKLYRSIENFNKQAQAFYDKSPLNKNRPHWYITIRPNTFKEDRISISKEYCCKKIGKYFNGYGGWDYPEIDPDFYNRYKEADMLPLIESLCDKIKGRKQHWGFYSSGLFVHLRSFLEEDESRRKEAEKQTEPYKRGNKGEIFGYIGINSVIHTTTKLFDFVGQLAQDFKDSTFFVEIKMPSVRNFLLYKDDKKPPACIWACQGIPIHILPIRVYKTSSDKLDKLAREAAFSIYKCFDLNNISIRDYFKTNITEGDLKNIQKDLRSGKLIT